MTDLDPDLFLKIENTARTVIDSLKKKGYVVPTSLPGNRVNFNGFIVGRDKEGYYIQNPRTDTLINRINLPQTAAVVANSLALGKYKIENILSQDRRWGYRDFDMMVFKRAMERTRNNIDQFAFWQTRYNSARQQAITSRNTIMHAFEKLRSLR